MLHKIKFQNNIYNVSLKKRTKQQQQKKKKKKKRAKEQKNKNKKKTKKKPRSKLLIAVLEEVVKISSIIFESHQRDSSV